MQRNADDDPNSDFSEFEFQSERYGHGPCGLLNEYFIRICARSETEATSILTRHHPEYEGKELKWQPPIPLPLLDYRGFHIEYSPTVITDKL